MKFNKKFIVPSLLTSALFVPSRVNAYEMTINTLTIAKNTSTNAKSMNAVILVLVIGIFGIIAYTIFSNRK